MCSCLVKLFSCFFKQLKCLLCGTSCSCCCSFFPSVNESTSTRLMYAFILFIITCLNVLVMSPYVLDGIVDMPDESLNSTCTNSDFGSNCLMLYGSIAVYRISFGTVLFFAILMVLTVGVKTSKDYRAYIHNGFWLWKIALLVFLIVVSFQIPFDGIIREFWMYVGMVAASVYIIINMLLIIELAYSWTEKMLNREHCQFIWCVMLIFLILLFITISVILTIYLYMNFVPSQECVYNNLLIGLISTTCFVFFLIAIVVAAKTRKTYTYLLPTSFLSAYVLLLTWSSLTSIPNLKSTNNSTIQLDQTFNETSKWCHSNDLIIQIDQKFIAYISVLIATFLSIYSSIKSSSHSKHLGIEVTSVPEVNFLLQSPFLSSILLLDFPVLCFGSQYYDSPSVYITQTNPLNLDSFFKREVCFGCCIKKRKRRLEKDKSNGQTLIRNEMDGVIYSYSFFHFIFMLAVFHNMMQLTNWTRPDTAHLDTFGHNMPTVYMKASSAVLCIFIFGGTLLASLCCPKKIVTRVPREDF